MKEGASVSWNVQLQQCVVKPSLLDVRTGRKET